MCKPNSYVEGGKFLTGRREMKAALEKLTKRTALLVIAALVGLAAFGFVIHNFVYPSFPIGVATESKPVPTLAPTPALVGTDLLHFQGNYGPILTATEALQLRSVAGVRNLAILYTDGDVKYSQGTVDFVPSSPWSISRPPEITGVRVDGTSVEIGDNHGQLFTLNVTEPFVFQNTLKRVYVIDGSGAVWSALLSDLSFIAQSLPDPGVAPNPDLSPSLD